MRDCFSAEMLMQIAQQNVTKYGLLQSWFFPYRAVVITKVVEGEILKI